MDDAAALTLLKEVTGLSDPEQLSVANVLEEGLNNACPAQIEATRLTGLAVSG